MSFSTIAAIATPHGLGGVAIVRISGAESFEIAQRIFRPRSGKSLSDYAPRTQIYGDILSSQDGEILDDGLLTKFMAPNSFTGEDVVEISCHGGEQITAMVLSAVLENGAVLAERGEFSRRSFLSGKMTLTSAEGIADLLDAKTSEAARLSSAAARGKLSEHLTKLSEKVLALSVSLWAYIDYPEEDLQTLSDEEMLLSLDEILSDADRLLQTYRTGRAIQNGVKTVIIGKPNVGKSTFFNAFLGEKKAIVTDIPGTTRDILEYPVKCGKVLLNLMDSAGVRGNTGDAIEKMGMELVFEALEDAELVFALFDGSEKLDDNDRIVMEKLQAKSDVLPIIPIITKCDKKTVIDLNRIREFSDPIRVHDGGNWNFDEIVERVESLFISDQRALREGAVITNARQKSYLVNAIKLLQEAKANIALGSKDIASLDLENALAALRELDGQSAGEEILNEVFSRFCIGK